MLPVSVFQTAADETQSTFSYQHSVLSEVPEVERRPTSSTLDLGPNMAAGGGGGAGGKPQESLVLQVYGLNQPSQEFRERLAGIIQRKLDATTLDCMCSVFARNQQLKLTAEDVEFLQPDRKPTHTLHVTLPQWLPNQHLHAFLFYYLQTVSSFTVHLLYVPSMQHKEHLKLHAPQELLNAYLVGGLQGGHSDHLCLYIRPQTKGRGMAVLCVSLADSTGRVQAPLLEITEPLSLPEGGVALEEEEGVVSEEGVAGGRCSIRVQVWEKGNIGLEEFMQKLSLCCQHTIMDYCLELGLLPCAVAEPVPSLCEGLPHEGLGVDSPVFVPGGQTPVKPSASHLTESPHKKSSSKSSDSSRHSSESVSRKVSLQMPESAISSEVRRPSALSSLPDSRRGSALSIESRRGSGESRRESGVNSDVRRSSGLNADSRRGSGLSALGSESSRKSSLASEGRKGLLAAGEGRKVSVGVKVGDVIEEVEENALSSPASMQDGEGQLLWLQREKARRVHEAMENLMREAELGKCGVMSETHNTAIPRHLSLAHSKASPSVRYLSIPLLGQYSLRGFLSHAAALLDSACSGLTSDAFRLSPAGYCHCTLEKDWMKISKTVSPHQLSTEIILISRDLAQWEDISKSASPPEPCLLQQLFHPLDSKRPPSPSPSFLHIPFLSIASQRAVFIPRRRLVFIRVTHQKVRERVVWCGVDCNCLCVCLCAGRGVAVQYL